MEGPRLTEERLRHHLDSNQVMRERMCLALLPLLGPYTHEQSRRPKGGPDSGRDIEAFYQGTIPVWGAVGFRNGGGADDPARNEAVKKFKADLDSALKENASLAGFVFFTNVDLTPAHKESLKAYSQGKNIGIVDIFDMERLRNVLDSPEGLIARVQYLEIPMSATEQAGLVAKFGSQLQNAVTARFDRVERTLAQMERFLEFQKPLLRLDLYVELYESATSAAIGDEAILFTIRGLHDIDKAVLCLCVNEAGRAKSVNSLIVKTYLWQEQPNTKIIEAPKTICAPLYTMASYNELSLTTGGPRVRIVDLTIVGLDVICTEGIHGKIRQVAVDVNGFELFVCPAGAQGNEIGMKWPEGLAYNAAGRKWVELVKNQQRNLLLSPPKSSGRLLPLMKLEIS